MASTKYLLRGRRRRRTPYEHRKQKLLLSIYWKLSSNLFRLSNSIYSSKSFAYTGWLAPTTSSTRNDQNDEDDGRRRCRLPPTRSLRIARYLFQLVVGLFNGTDPISIRREKMIPPTRKITFAPLLILSERNSLAGCCWVVSFGGSFDQRIVSISLSLTQNAKNSK